MRKITIDERKSCLICRKIENQVKIVFNRSETQRCKCKEGGKTYTLDPKKHEYPEEILKAVAAVFVDVYNRFSDTKFLFWQSHHTCELPFSQTI